MPSCSARWELELTPPNASNPSQRAEMRYVKFVFGYSRRSVSTRLIINGREKSAGLSRNIDPRPRIGQQPAALALIYKQKMTLAEKRKKKAKSSRAQKIHFSRLNREWVDGWRPGRRLESRLRLWLAAVRKNMWQSRWCNDYDYW